MTSAKDTVFAEIAESEATGRTREIYDDFKASIGLPMVNLVYRHMATTPGCLEWAWGLLRPLFVSSAMADEAARLLAGLSIGDPAPITREMLREAGIDASAERAIIETIEAYDRANPMNLIAMAVLAVELEDGAEGEGEAPPDTESPPPPAATALPPLADVRTLPEQTLAVLATLAAQAGIGGSPVIPTLYLHMTDWPGFLDIAAATVAPLDDDGRLGQAASALREEARRAAARLPRYAVGQPAPSEGQRRNLLGLVELFPEAISRMIVIGAHLRRSMPD
jgi:hypothetical protein